MFNERKEKTWGNDYIRKIPKYKFISSKERTSLSPIPKPKVYLSRSYCSNNEIYNKIFNTIKEKLRNREKVDERVLELHIKIRKNRAQIVEGAQEIIILIIRHKTQNAYRAIIATIVTPCPTRNLELAMRYAVWLWAVLTPLRRNFITLNLGPWVLDTWL